LDAWQNKILVGKSQEFTRDTNEQMNDIKMNTVLGKQAVEIYT